MKSRRTEPTTKATKPAKCPKCDSPKLVPLLVGLPSAKADALADRGEIALAGCIPRDPQPEWCCRACGWEWFELGRPASRELERLFSGVEPEEGQGAGTSCWPAVPLALPAPRPALPYTPGATPHGGRNLAQPGGMSAGFMESQAALRIGTAPTTATITTKRGRRCANSPTPGPKEVHPMATKKLQRARKPDKAATARLPDHLAGLPYEIARARAYIADADDRLRFIADTLEPAIHEFSTGDHPDRIRAAATQIWANVVAAASVLLDLAVFVGKLEGLAAVDPRSGAGE